MVDPSQKQQYLEQIAQKLSVSVDDIMTVLYGEELLDDATQYKKIFNELVYEQDVVFFVLIWNGKRFPGTQRNIEQYRFIGQLMEAFNLAIYRTDYLTQIIPYPVLLADYGCLERIIIQRPNCGVLMTVHNTVSSLAYQVCKDYQRPIVFLDPPVSVDPDELYTITIDDKEATRSIISHLIELGHRRISFINGYVPNRVTEQRFAGYREALSENNILFDENLVRIGNWREPSGYEAAQDFLAMTPRPTAIFAASDQMALGVMQAVADAGLSIPEDISVAGFDNIADGLATNPPLTTVHQPISKIGKEAAHILMDLLEGRQPEPRHVVFPTELIIRQSTGHPPQ